MAKNTDDLIAEMMRDEAEGAEKLSPREYGLLRGIQPQLVYYHIREGHVKKEICICGRSVIDVQAADEYFQKGKFDTNSFEQKFGDDEGDDDDERDG